MLEEDVDVDRYMAYYFELCCIEKGVMCSINAASKDVVVRSGGDLVRDEFCERVEADGEAV